MDCSGFTKTVYFMNGLVIPRDASQQVHAGQPVDSEQPFDQLEVGDLLFFGTPATSDKKERVVHVGMWIGDKKFIHASGQVRVSSVDPDDEHYDEYNVNRFLRARRYAPGLEGSILQLKNEVLF
jgi:cell wall-associated NlpC family hydrolase